MISFALTFVVPDPIHFDLLYGRFWIDFPLDTTSRLIRSSLVVPLVLLHYIVDRRLTQTYTQLSVNLTDGNLAIEMTNPLFKKQFSFKVSDIEEIGLKKVIKGNTLAVELKESSGKTYSVPVGLLILPHSLGDVLVLFKLLSEKQPFLRFNSSIHRKHLNLGSSSLGSLSLSARLLKLMMKVGDLSFDEPVIVEQVQQVLDEKQGKQDRGIRLWNPFLNQMVIPFGTMIILVWFLQVETDTFITRLLIANVLFFIPNMIDFVWNVPFFWYLEASSQLSS